MAHVKSNSWSAGALEARLGSELAQLDGFRARLFLELYWQVHTEWERKLAAEGSIDFEDMLVRAAGHLEAGDVDCPYELVMVDELQDASRARARLVKALVKAPGRFLLAVGDDWQSINRFAGADISVMTEFEAWFGRGQQLALTTTFRCPQSVCDVARAFVTKNPAQFKKPMRSAQRDRGLPVKVVQADDPARALVSYLEDLSSQVADARVVRNGGGTVSVDVLGRYWHERDVLPRHPPSNLKVTFRTVDSSKGLEADYIVLPGLTTGRYGFPSDMADDPVLDVAMPRTRSLPARRGAPPLLRGTDPGPPRGHGYHLAGSYVPLRCRAPGRPQRDGHGEQWPARRGLPRVREGDDGPAERQVRLVPRLLCLPGVQAHTQPVLAAGDRVAARAGRGFRRTRRAAPLQLDLDVGTAPA